MEIFTVKQDVSIEYTEKKSLFIGHAFFVTEESEAMAAIASVKRELGAKWAAGVIFGQCAVAWIAAFVVRMIGMLSGLA